MSEPLRIALVAEGVTDYVILNAAITAILGERPFVLNLLQPESSVAFTAGGDAGPLGGGWRGVYRWCRQAADRSGGSLPNDPLFLAFDLLLIHLDADVAGEDPANYPVNPLPELDGLFPCESPCPPPDATTNELRRVLSQWLGETSVPPKVVLCTPSKSADAWMIAVNFPTDREMTRRGWECHPDPASRLAQQPKKKRFAKSQLDYEQHAGAITSQWPQLTRRMTEALRFDSEFRQAIS